MKEGVNLKWRAYIYFEHSKRFVAWSNVPHTKQYTWLFFTKKEYQSRTYKEGPLIQEITLQHSVGACVKKSRRNRMALAFSFIEIFPTFCCARLYIWSEWAEICPSPGPQTCSWFPAGFSAVATGAGHILSSQGGQHRTSQAQSAHSMNKMPICPGLPLLAPKIKISRPHAALSGLDLRPGSGTIFLGASSVAARTAERKK